MAWSSGDCSGGCLVRWFGDDFEMIEMVGSMEIVFLGVVHVGSMFFFKGFFL